jgi:hypothetical protein
MTTTDSSFIAQGPAKFGFYARGTFARPPGGPFRFGVLALGKAAGVYGATDDGGPIPPSTTLWGNAAGVLGSSLTSYGVVGSSILQSGVGGFSSIASGVFGYSEGIAGVEGYSWTSPGILGGSQNSSGVVGVVGSQIPPVSTPPTAGVVGIATLQGPALAQAPQVGKNILPPTAGVTGTADQNPGVIGTSNAAIGIYGFSTGNSGVVGETANPNSFAGYFAGNVHVTGNLTVAGPVKGAIMPFPDGTQRVLYCMESPEPWFEDFGSGKLKRGRAVVKIDRDFAKVIKRGDYHVFLTPRGDCRGLYVRSQGGASFEVRELGGGRSRVAFSYRIVAQRKDAKRQGRFAKIDTRLALPRGKPARPPRHAKVAPATPEGRRAFAARMRKAAQGQLRKRGRKGRRS